MDLDILVNEYAEKQDQLNDLKADLEAMKVVIIENMENQGLCKFTTPDGLNVSLTYKDLIKYSDEPAIIQYCEENGLNNYIVKKVNTTALNKDLKKSESLTESLNKYYTVNKTKALTVKRG